MVVNSLQSSIGIDLMLKTFLKLEKEALFTLMQVALLFNASCNEQVCESLKLFSTC